MKIAIIYIICLVLYLRWWYVIGYRMKYIDKVVEDHYLKLGGDNEQEK